MESQIALFRFLYPAFDIFIFAGASWLAPLFADRGSTSLSGERPQRAPSGGSEGRGAARPLTGGVPSDTGNSCGEFRVLSARLGGFQRCRPDPLRMPRQNCASG